jgi:hypothetical protein
VSKGHGTGSPVWFRCTRDRRGEGIDHTVTLTGRSRPYHSKRAMGSRSTDRAREYECSCGHVGWSNHIRLAEMAGEPRHTDHPEWS